MGRFIPITTSHGTMTDLNTEMDHLIITGKTSITIESANTLIPAIEEDTAIMVY